MLFFSVCQHKPVDIVFILDGSGSVNQAGFNQTLTFVSDIISRYSAETTRFGVMVFSSAVTLEYNLGDYVNDTESMIEKLYNAT